MTVQNRRVQYSTVWAYMPAVALLRVKDPHELEPKAF